MIFANIFLYFYLLVFIHPDCHYHHAGDHDAGVGMIVKHIKSSKIESYGEEEEKNTSGDGDGETIVTMLTHRVVRASYIEKDTVDY